VDHGPLAGGEKEVMKQLALSFALALLAASAVEAQPLGRFFFTPAERAELDGARVQKKQAPALAPVPEAPATSKPLPQTVTYGGVVRRSDGRSMLWMNGRLADEQDALAKLDLQGRLSPDGSVALHVPESGTDIRMKVGQSVDLPTGKVAERSRLKAEPASSKDAKDASLDEERATPDAQQTPRSTEPKQQRAQAGAR
jgi:hypothetical protein